MATQHVRIGLTNHNFPMLSSGIGESKLLQNGLDAVTEQPGTQRMPLLKPQLIYCENVLPTTEGLRSGKLTQLVSAALAPASNNFGEIYNVSDAAGNIGWFAPDGGNNQLWKGTTWAGTTNYGAGKETSHANIAGQSYVCWELTGIQRINVGAGTISANTDAGDTIVGKTAADIKGICASGDYLIWYDDTTVGWSSPTDPMDLTPSTVTGAGSATPSDLKGIIVAVLQNANGFFIYTTQNIVSAVATGNALYPFVFKHVPQSAGLMSGYDKATEAVANMAFIYANDGLQQIEATGVSGILPDVTDFIRGRIIESYDAATGVITQTQLSADMELMLHHVSERYLVISYGATTPFQYALVYDKVLRRWGKIKVSHVEVISLPPSHAAATRELCFVSADGSVVQFSLEATNTTASGVAVFGRIGTTRGSSMTLLGVDIEHVKATDTVTCRVATSYYGGASQDSIETIVGVRYGNMMRYQPRTVGMSHSVHFTGMFNLTSFGILGTQGGNR